MERLSSVNRAFYSQFAAQFAQTRSPEQAGVQQLAELLPTTGRLLDLGCGNGRLARLLSQQQRSLSYVGVDSSVELLAIARADTAGLPMATDFVHADMSREGWTQRLPAGRFDAVVALALLHHIPGWQSRLSLLAQMAALLADDGLVALSAWQFLNEARLRRKIVSWSAVDLEPGQVEPGDYLLDWKRGGYGLRYCHLIDAAEIEELARDAGLSLQAVFYADGAQANLNLFAVLRTQAGTAGHGALQTPTA